MQLAASHSDATIKEFREYELKAAQDELARLNALIPDLGGVLKDA